MKKILSVLLALALVLALGISVSAETPLINDFAGYLTSDEQAALEEQFLDIRDQYGYTPYLVTSTSLEGKSAHSYADDFYEDNGLDNDGILLLISLEEGYWYITVNGLCAAGLSDSDVDVIGEAVVEKLRSGDYYGAVSLFAAKSTACVQEDGSGSSGLVFSFSTVLIALVIGLIVGLVVVLIMVSGMKTIRANPTANYYVKDGSMHLRHSQDIFLYSNVTKIRKESSSSSGGGGGRSRSSGGGRSHGGSGGRI